MYRSKNRTIDRIATNFYNSFHRREAKKPLYRQPQIFDDNDFLQILNHRKLYNLKSKKNQEFRFRDF